MCLGNERCQLDAYLALESFRDFFHQRTDGRNIFFCLSRKPDHEVELQLRELKSSGCVTGREDIISRESFVDDSAEAFRSGLWGNSEGARAALRQGLEEWLRERIRPQRRYGETSTHFPQASCQFVNSRVVRDGGSYQPNPVGVEQSLSSLVKQSLDGSLPRGTIDEARQAEAASPAAPTCDLDEVHVAEFRVGGQDH